MSAAEGTPPMDLIQIMISLSENNDARIKIDPRIQLAALYREIREMRNAVSDMENKLEQATGARERCREEIRRIIDSKPIWAKEIESAKESLVYKRGLTLKEMLAIQQSVARAENDISQADSLIANLRLESERHERDRKRILVTLQELKAQYNQHAFIYNQEKSEADALMAGYNERENELLARLSPRDRVVYQEALRLNPESPIVFLDGEVCLGCKIGLPKQMVKYVNQLTGLVCCENCLRVVIPYSGD